MFQKAQTFYFDNFSDVFSAVDFGSGEDAATCFKYESIFEAKGPPMNPEVSKPYLTFTNKT